MPLTEGDGEKVRDREDVAQLLAELLAVKLTVPVHESDDEKQALSDCVPVASPDALALSEALRLPVGEPEDDTLADRQRLADAEPLAAPLPELVSEGVDERHAVALSVGDSEGVTLALREGEGEAHTLAEGVVVAVTSASVCDGVALALKVVDSEPQGVGVAEPLSVPLTDAVVEGL